MIRIKYKRVLRVLFGVLSLAGVLAGIGFSGPVVYATHAFCANGAAVPEGTVSPGAVENFCANAPAPEGPGSPHTLDADCDDPTALATDCRIVGHIRTFTRGLSALVGVVIVIMIAYGGIRYSSSRGNPQETATAVKHITNAIMALVIYLFMFAFLQWVIPGGIY